MASRKLRLRPRFDGKRMAADMALRGWNNVDMARKTRLSVNTIRRFLMNDIQTPKTADLMAHALGHPLKRYFTGIAPPVSSEREIA